MIMILFGALSAGTKTYLLCRSDRHAKRLRRRMTAQPYNRFVFVSWSWCLPYNGNQA